MRDPVITVAHAADMAWRDGCLVCTMMDGREEILTVEEVQEVNDAWYQAWPNGLIEIPVIDGQQPPTFTWMREP